MLQSQLSNYFYPQQKLTSKVRDGAKVTRKFDRATTPHRRAMTHTVVSAQDKNILTDTYDQVNPAALQRQIQALSAELLALATSKTAATSQPVVRSTAPVTSTRPNARRRGPGDRSAVAS